MPRRVADTVRGIKALLFSKIVLEIAFSDRTMAMSFDKEQRVEHRHRIPQPSEVMGSTARIGRRRVTLGMVVGRIGAGRG